MDRYAEWSLGLSGRAANPTTIQTSKSVEQRSRIEAKIFKRVLQLFDSREFYII
jgi:hypothetical protein